MRRPGVTAKLFLAILGVTLSVVVLMTLAVQVTFREDFLDYRRGRERERLEALAGVLTDYYREAGDWQALAHPPRWRYLLREALWRYEEGRDHDGERDEEQSEPFEALRDKHGPPDHDDRPMPPPRFGPTLLNASGDHVAGPAMPRRESESIEIVVNGATAGWLVYEPPGRITNRLALHFQHEQFETAWMIAALVVVIAAVVSMLLARSFLAPVRRLARGTRALAAGHFDTRVPQTRRDELGQLARDFNRLAETLQRNEQLRRAFMADMSHELRTPVSVLRAELEAMEDGVRPLNRESLATLQGSIATLTKLIEDLYELSLADAGALNYRMETLDLGALAWEAAQRWQSALADAGLALATDLPDQPVLVTGDRRRLDQLLDNVFRNSLSYTEHGGRIRLAVATEGREAVLYIEDSAPGVPDEALSRLFDRLFRVEGSRSRASGGAGLGLAICRNIAEAHDGRITAYHAPEGGVGIRLTLPLDGDVARA